MKWHHRGYLFCEFFRTKLSYILCATFSSWLIISVVLALDKSQMEQRMLDRYGELGATRLHQWLLLISDIKLKTDQDKINQVNHFFNSRIHFQDDKQLWKNIDYWATPLETLGMNAGDCEDYAIAKYFTLLEAGVAVERLRFIYVKAQIGDSSSRLFQAHMVLGYYETEDKTPYILDNLVSHVELATKRTDLKPVFSFNSGGIWVGNQETKADPTARLSRWRDLLQRTQADGF